MLGLCTLLMAGTVNYTADDESVFASPERGFITMLTGHLTKKNPYAVKGQESTLNYYIANEQMSIVLVHYYLDQFIDKETLPDEVLNGFDADMQVLRNKGMKAIVRFSYAEDTYLNIHGDYSGKDAPLSIAKKHIAQYKSHWQANADVIYVFQAGFVGAWGEWYYTDNYGNMDNTMNSTRRQLVETLLDAVPADRCIQLRTPLFKTGYVGSNKPLKASEAHQNTPKARLAHHNDAFLENYGDLGTYVDTAKEKPYIAQETLYVPIGGESCITDEEVAKQNASKAKTTAEMSRLHWSFIQSGYSPVVTDRWRKDGTFEELNRKMGYRLQLVSGTFSDEVIQGENLNVQLQIKNVGYAPLYNERHAYIVLKPTDSSLSADTLPLTSDPRSWLPNGVLTTINEDLTLPSDIPAGTYKLYLYLPDAYETLASDPRYAVRFANKNTWDKSTGMNSLNATVTVKTPQVDPDPEIPTAIDEKTLPANTASQKVVQDGQVLIQHEKKTYNTQGMELSNP